jgi:hypothetical protein
MVKAFGKSAYPERPHAEEKLGYEVIVVVEKLSWFVNEQLMRTRFGKSVRILGRETPAYCISFDCPDPMPSATAHVSAPPFPSLFWADKIHFVLCGFSHNNVFRGVECRKTCTSHQSYLWELIGG